MENGFWVKNKRRLTRKYVTEGTFRYDLAALMPLDFLYFQFGVNATLLRLPRLIKVVAFKEFTNRLENCLTKPYFLRIVKTVVYMLYLIHLNACAYFAISAWEIKHGIVSESEDSRKKFVYDGPTDWTAYIRCFYFATKTATSIGKNKKSHQPRDCHE
jgi:succinate dehydrogenase/fumarate reductase cytochrome b subunit